MERAMESIVSTFRTALRNGDEYTIYGAEHTVKKKLLIILGSGSSIPLGMPSVVDLDEQMAGWAREWAAQPNHGHNYFETLRQSINDYYGSRVCTTCPPVNFEKILGEMLALSHWMTPSPWGDTLRQAVCGDGPPSRLFLNADDHGTAIALRAQLGYLSTQLAALMRACSQRLDTRGDAFGQYAALFQTLRHSFDVGIFNLNYDTAAITAMPGAHTGFGDDGIFEPRAVHLRADWDFVYHLHGSVHHSLVAPNVKRICWRADLAGEFWDTDEGIGPDMRSEGRLFPVTTLLAGGFKLDQMLAEPFQSLHAALIRHVHEADAIVIGGYGFGDAHINHILKNRLATSCDRPPILVLDRRPKGAVSFTSDGWATGLCQALRTDGSFFTSEGDTVRGAGMEAAGGCFEVAKTHRIALSSGGFVEAASRIESIVPWLIGQSGYLPGAGGLARAEK
jgi:hypothetical protein